MSDWSIVVTDEDPLPPYEQVRRQLARLVRVGTLRPGDRLPPLRQLAGDLGLAVGTVARAYRELEEGGLLETRRGGGTRVAAHPPAGDPTAIHAELDAEAQAYVRSALRLGATPGEVSEAVMRALALGSRPH